MKFTPKQLAEMECIKWFVPSILRDVQISEQDCKDYLNISERGIRPKTQTQGLEALLQGKRWRGIHCDTSWDKDTGKATNRAMYEEGILEGTVPYMSLLGDYDRKVLKPWWKRLFSKQKYYFYRDPMPRVVVDYLKKSLFGGMDKELIEECYHMILSDKKRL